MDTSTIVTILIIAGSLVLKFVVTLMEDRKKPVDFETDEGFDTSNAEDSATYQAERVDKPGNLGGESSPKSFEELFEMLIKPTAKAPEPTQADVKTISNNEPMYEKRDKLSNHDNQTTANKEHSHAKSRTTHKRSSEDKNGENRAVLEEIGDDFDLRKAVIYSEILTPKFKESE